MNLIEVPKKTQLISLDSRNVTSGDNSLCQFRFGLESNVFIEDFKDVIGISLVDFFITQNTAAGATLGRVVDVEIEEVPTRGQILDASLGKLFARVPLVSSSNFSVMGDGDVGDQWRGSYKTPVRYFNPISLDRITARISQVSETGVRTDIPSYAWWFMILEITTIDHETPKPDTLAIAIDNLSKNIMEMPPPVINAPAEEPKKIQLWKVVIPILLLCGTGWWFFRTRLVPPTNITPIYRPQ